MWSVAACATARRCWMRSQARCRVIRTRPRHRHGRISRSDNGPWPLAHRIRESGADRGAGRRGVRRCGRGCGEAVRVAWPPRRGGVARLRRASARARLRDDLRSAHDGERRARHRRAAARSAIARAIDLCAGAAWARHCSSRLHSCAARFAPASQAHRAVLRTARRLAHADTRVASPADRIFRHRVERRRCLGRPTVRLHPVHLPVQHHRPTGSIGAAALDARRPAHRLPVRCALRR